MGQLMARWNDTLSWSTSEYVDSFFMDKRSGGYLSSTLMEVPALLGV